MNDKINLEQQIETHFRLIKDKDLEKQDILNLKLKENTSDKSLNNKMLQEKLKYIKQLQTEVDSKKEQISKNQELIL